ncbi:3-phytase [marine bacterium AO1-C]|nr:3-phytase [marine bacterium AO1-C]
MNLKHLMSILGVAATLYACETKTTNQTTETNTEENLKVETVSNTQEGPTDDFPVVLADMETEPVNSADDAADDPAVWVHPKKVGESTIIGTNKKKGLAVYDLNGKQLFFYPVGRINNVDVRYGFLLGDKKVDIVAGSNRTKNSVGVWTINSATKELEEAQARDLNSKIEEVYGFCLYKSPKTKKIYAFVVGKSGAVEQWELFDNGQGKIDGKIVRSFVLKSQCEGMVADDETGVLYIAEENNAIWKFDAEPEGATEGKLIADLTNIALKDDLEGITIYYAANKKGYLIASSQGNNSYAIFERGGDHAYLGSFSIGDSESIDGTSDTDGIDVISFGLGEKYPNGFFIAQDGTNNETKNGEASQANQNFKVVSWEKIVQSMKGKLITDNAQNPRKVNE